MIDEKFSPAVTIMLEGNTFSISGSSAEKAGSITRKDVVVREDVMLNRVTASLASSILALGLIVFALLTKNRDTDLMKRYEKWIVNIERTPSGDFLPVF